VGRTPSISTADCNELRKSCSADFLQSKLYRTICMLFSRQNSTDFIYRVCTQPDIIQYFLIVQTSECRANSFTKTSLYIFFDKFLPFLLNLNFFENTKTKMQPQWKHRGLMGSRDNMYNFVEAGYCRIMDVRKEAEATFIVI
jgi:hypothetical protein